MKFMAWDGRLEGEICLQSLDPVLVRCQYTICDSEKWRRYLECGEPEEFIF